MAGRDSIRFSASWFDCLLTYMSRRRRRCPARAIVPPSRLAFFLCLSFDIWRLRLGAVLRRATCMPLSRPRVFRSASLGSSPPAVEDCWYSRHVCYRVLSLFHSSRGSVRYRVPTSTCLLFRASRYRCVLPAVLRFRCVRNLSTFQPFNLCRGVRNDQGS